jgi:hypothetical protein
MAISICVVISGAQSKEEIVQNGKIKQKWLSTFLALPNGIPSHDKFTRVIPFLIRYAQRNLKSVFFCERGWLFRQFVNINKRAEICPVRLKRKQAILGSNLSGISRTNGNEKKVFEKTPFFLPIFIENMPFKTHIMLRIHWE